MILDKAIDIVKSFYVDFCESRNGILFASHSPLWMAAGIDLKGLPREPEVLLLKRNVNSSR